MIRNVTRLNARTAFTIPGTHLLRRRLSGEWRLAGLCSYISRTDKARSYLDVLGSQSAHTIVRYAHVPTSAMHSSALAPGLMKFDKVPDKLPDWWDEEDDDDEEMEGKGNSGNRGESGDGRGGGSSGGGGGNGNSEGDGFFATLLAMYVQAVRKYPIRTKATSTCLLALLGDYFAQRIAQRQDPGFSLDVRRSASIGVWGFCFMGPVLHYWYGLLDRMFLGRYAVLSKVLSDQILFAPFFNGAFIAGVGSLEGHPTKEVSETVKTKLWPSMKANWTLWPAAQLINFTVIPRTFQIVYVNCVALVWNVILTYISHEET